MRRKGLAYGVMWSAKSAAGVALPFGVSGCLERFGVETTLQGWTVLMVSSSPISPWGLVARTDERNSSS